MIPQMQNESAAANDDGDEEGLEDDLPPLEQLSEDIRPSVQARTTFTDRKAPSPEPSPDNSNEEETVAERVKRNLANMTVGDSEIAAKIKEKLNEITVA